MTELVGKWWSGLIMSDGTTPCLAGGLIISYADGWYLSNVIEWVAGSFSHQILLSREDIHYFRFFDSSEDLGYYLKRTGND